MRVSQPPSTTAADRDAPAHPGPSQWPWAPILIGVWSVALLWADNTSEVVAADTLPVLAWVVPACIGVTVAAMLALRSMRRGALLATVVVLVAVTYGRMVPAATPTWLGVAGISVLALLGGILLLRHEPDRLAGPSKLANVTAAALLAALVPSLAPAIGGGDAAILPAAVPQQPLAAGAEPRDIFYVVPDRYGRADQLLETFDYDNSRFVDFLEQRDFQVAERSLTNYPRTPHSLASTLNMTYLDEVADRIEPGDADRIVAIHRMLADHRVGDILTESGYEYVHVGGWWNPTATGVDADVVLNYDPDSEFERVYASTTIVPPLLDVVGARSELSEREVKGNHTLYQLEQLERLAAERSARPRFVFAHLTIPHTPYVFAADGRFLDAAEAGERTWAQNYAGQATYANGRLERIIEVLLARPPAQRPIIVIQADEGPTVADFYRDPEFTWQNRPISELELKFNILSAIHLPGPDAPRLPETVTPVNTFRVILEHYLGVPLQRLPDHAFIYTDKQHLYDFLDVTDRLRRH